MPARAREQAQSAGRVGDGVRQHGDGGRGDPGRRLRLHRETDPDAGADADARAGARAPKLKEENKQLARRVARQRPSTT